MPLTIGNKINLQELERQAALGHGDQYLHQSGTGLALSAHPLKKNFLFVPYGQSAKHANGLRQIRDIVQKQYGFRVQSQGNLLTVNSLLRQINASKEENRRDLDRVVQSVRNQYGNQHAASIQVDLTDKYRTGEVLTANEFDAVHQKFAHRLEREEFGNHLAQLFGQQARTDYLNLSNAAMTTGDKLSDAEKAHWLAYAKTKLSGQELVGRIQQELGQPAALRAGAALQAKLDGIASADAPLPPEVAQGGQLPKSWSDAMVDAAHDQAQSGLRAQHQNAPQQLVPALDLATGKAQRLKDQAQRLASIEHKLTHHPSGANLDALPKALFENGAIVEDHKIFDLCDDLVSLANTQQAKGRLQAEHPQAAAVGQRFDTAAHIARLGQQLRQQGVHPAEAALILRMELAERAAGRGNPDPSRFSPQIGNNLQIMQGLARRGVQWSQQGLSAKVVDQLLQAELSERAKGRGPHNPNQLTGIVQQLAQGDPGQIDTLLKADVSLATYADYRARGAANRQEVISCVKLGINPENLQVDRQAVSQDTWQRLQQWQQAGFNRAESQAYLSAQMTNPEFSRYRPRDFDGFQGSHLTPEAMLAYQRVGAEYHPATAVGQFNPDNQIGAQQKLGSGYCNTVFLGAYHGATGIEQRVFKPEPSPSRIRSLQGSTDIEHGVARRNVATHRIDKLLNFGSVPEAEFAIIKNEHGKQELGVSMSLAPGQEASAWAGKVDDMGGLLEVSTPPTNLIEVKDSTQFNNLLRYKDRIAADPKLADILAKRLGVGDIHVDHQNRLMVQTNFMRYNRDDANLRRELTQLQLLDALCAQKDRHSSNYMVQLDPQGHTTKVTGIDNDMSFDAAVTNPADLAGHQGKVAALPPVIDRQMHDAIMGLQEQAVRHELQGLLSPQEINATVSRMNHLKAHAQQLEAKQQVIDDPQQWSAPWVTELMNKKNSYAMRDTA